MKNVLSTLALSLSMLGGAAVAGTPADTPEGGSPATFSATSASRADVLDALREAKAAGLVWHAEGGQSVQTASTGLTRAQVAADTAQARALGLITFGESDQTRGTGING